MANKVQLKAAGDQDFTDNDPFAELTRIMGFDPRVQPTPRPDEDFEIDLEKELMGMFDPGSDAPAEPASVRDYPQEAVDNAAAPHEATADDIDEAFAAKLEEELSGDTGFWSEEQGTAAADEEPQPLDAYSGQDTRRGEVEDIMAEVDMDFGSSQPEDPAHDAEADDAGGWVADEDNGAGDRIADVPMVEDAMPSEEGSEEGNVFRPTFFTPLDADRPSAGSPLTTGYAPSAQDMEQAGPAVAPVFDIRSFKSAAQQYREAQPRYEVTFADERAADEPAEESPAPRAKAVDPFDILAALGTERALPQRRDPLKAPAPEAYSFEKPEQAEPNGFAPGEALMPQDYAPQEIGEWDAVSPEAVDAAEPNWEPEIGALEEPAAEEAVSASFEGMPFFDIRPVEQTCEAATANPVEESEYEPHVASPSGKADAPDIETTEIEEPAVPIADDLDIPVPAFLTEAHPAPVYDELDEEFEHAFQALSANTEAIRHAAVAPEQPAVAQTNADIERLFAEELGIGGAVAAASAAAPSAVAAGQETAARRPVDDFEEFDFDDTDFLPDEFTSSSREADDGFAAGNTGAARFLPRQARVPEGRGKLVAAAIAGVVVLGGIGVFAFSGSGTATADKPVVLKADADPVKVKPKNPGGVTVPNQDNKVYERVADGATAVAPEQKKLVSTEEQPVDISAQAKDTATALPGVFEGDQITSEKDAPSDNGTASSGDVAASVSAAAAKGDIADIIKAAPKGEDRLTPSQDTTRKQADNEVLSVTPHKVKTMIVRADGTMVPREDPAPVDTGVKTAEADAVVSTDLPTAAPIPTQEPQAVKNTPAKIAAAPVRPADQPANAADAKAQKVASAEAAPKPAPVAEASGNWSVQIASQPTAEAAQTSYQNMARRHADILGGHAVNIVKADVSGKGTYYRVRIAANSKDDAIALCTKYKAAGGNCFVSK